MSPEQARNILSAITTYSNHCERLDALLETAEPSEMSDEIVVRMADEFLAAKAEFENIINSVGVIA